MKPRSALETGLKTFGVLWAATIAALGVMIYLDYSDSYAVARPVVFVIFAVCLAFGVGAVILMQHKKWRWSGLVLIVSVATPTGYAYIGNVLALFVGLWLLLAGAEIAKRDAATSAGASRPGPMSSTTRLSGLTD